MKLKRISLVLLGIVAAFALMGCGGSGGSNEEATQAFTGTWEWVSETVDEGEAFTDEEIAEYKEMGLTDKLVISADGTFVYDSFGELATGTWTAKDGTSIDFEFSDDSILSASLENGVLTAFFGNGDTLYEKTSEPAPATASEYVSSAPAE